MSSTGCDFPAPRRSSRPADDEGKGLRRGVLAFALVAIIGCLFWATATIAEWTGTGNGMRTARNLDDLAPGHPRHPGPPVPDRRHRQGDRAARRGGRRFQFRYRGLRLLIHGGGKLFLVPEKWSPSDSTLLVPLDDSVRVQFRFVNRAP